MKRLLMATVLFGSVAAHAETIRLQSNIRGASSVDVNTVSTLAGEIHQIQFNMTKVEANALAGHAEFKVFSEKEISFSQDVGLPSVPFKSIVVAGEPATTDVVVDLGQAVTVKGLSAPAQKEISRNAKAGAWVFSPKARAGVKKEYLGTYRGQPLTRVTIYAGGADYTNNQTLFFPNLRAQITTQGTVSDLFQKETDAAYDYLIVSPKALLAGLSDLVFYKNMRGHVVKTVVLEDIGSDVAKISAFFKSEYKENKYKYALIVGTDTLFPNHQVNTSGSSKTPSDYPYFLMDSNDMIPDVQYGRVVASTPEEVKRQSHKWMDYQERRSDVAGLLRMIGIASNEGSNPSDEDYVKGIETDLAAAYGTTTTHFHQDSPTSKPGPINDAFNKGVGYLTYLGHGSGTSWASTGVWYATGDAKKIENANVQQPIIIDVACQNGILKKGYLGETFMNSVDSRGDAVGAAMYLGGSVNISWHPPAIMARGIVKRTIANKLGTIGDAILAGQLYLLENHTDVEAVRDNFEWYHLFGEPSSNIYFK
ncbi:MAG: C25 family cysteine peptidase [Bdellovibrionota bacterium]